MQRNRANTQLKAVQKLAQELANSTLSAIKKYGQISNVTMEYMPESFLLSYAFLNLRRVMTLETNAGTLWEWNRCEKKRAGSNDLGPSTPPEQFAKRPGAKRFDAVFYVDKGPKERHGLFALVEFKRWQSDSRDVDKVEDALRFIDMCPFGLVVWFAHIPKEKWNAEESLSDTSIAEHNPRLIEVVPSNPESVLVHGERYAAWVGILRSARNK